MSRANETYKFKKLNVWKFSVEFVSQIYQLTDKYPRSEQFGLTDQIRRASVSISLNIAEGSGAGTDLEYVRFLRMARRSCFEVVAALEISLKLSFGDASTIAKILLDADELSAMLMGLIKSIKLPTQTTHSS